jgi:uncharacterized membrane protein YebE (DUF533 family)
MDTKKLMKILIGAAWIDGIIQPEERVYLKKMATENGLSEDKEIKLLLTEIKQIKAEQCYQWLEEYLGEKRNEEDYQELMNAISALIYSDGKVDSEEAKLLTRLQMLDPANESHQTVFDRLLKGIQKLYREAIQ